MTNYHCSLFPTCENMITIQTKHMRFLLCPLLYVHFTCLVPLNHSVLLYNQYKATTCGFAILQP